MNEGRDAAVEAAIDPYVQGRRSASDELDEDQRGEIQALLAVADLLWEEAHGAPPLADDPVAAMLGLVPDPARSLDPRALARVTKSAGIKPSELARALTRRGWEVSTGDVFNWQTRGSQEVSPALIQAIAEITGSTIGSLTLDRGASPVSSELRAVTETPRFKELVVRWAQLRRTSPDLATSALTARLATSVHRGGQPDADQMLNSLEALVAALEEDGPGASNR
jgi:hypothetical protein